MKLVLLGDSLIGKRLEVPVYSSNGMMVTNKGFELTGKIIDRLNQMGVRMAYIESDDDEITMQEAIETPIRLQMLKILKAALDEAKKKKYIDEKPIYQIATDIIDNINISENALTLSYNVGDFKDGMELPLHLLNTAIYSVIVGKQRNIAKNKLFDMTVGALLHDVGHLFTKGEDHVQVGYEFIKKNRAFSVMCAICALTHHKNVNDTGFPNDIRAESLTEYSKIISLCSYYDTLFDSKNKAILPHEAIEVIAANAGTMFDTEIYKDFMRSIYCYPNGLPVKLNNGEEGLVILQNRSFPQRPIVKTKNKIYNLVEHLTLFIDKVAI